MILKVKHSVSLFFLMFLSISQSEEIQKTDDAFCIPGASYHDFCRKVTCRQDLDSKTYLEYAPSLEDTKNCILATQISGKFYRECIPGKKYFDGCNECRCDGKQISSEPVIRCTDKPCNIDTLSPSEDFWMKPGKRRRCVPGSRYHNGCTECHCDIIYELPFCEPVACPSPLPPPDEFWRGNMTK